jgi:alanine racemase
MESFRHLPVQPRRDAWVEINLDAIEQNAKKIRQRVPAHVDLMAIVKADAYGHGASMVLQTLAASGVSLAGVASVDEALNLRRAGISLPILVIGAIPDWSVQFAAQDEIRLTIFNQQHLNILNMAAKRRIQQSGTIANKVLFRVHIKIDTGMHRIGVPWEKASEFIAQCREIPGVDIEGIFTHFADSQVGEQRQKQVERWKKVCDSIQPLPHYVHSANSVAALDKAYWLEHAPSQDNLARLGIAFYGYGPEELHLQPAMGLKARILNIQELSSDEGVSYGPHYKTPSVRPITRIATIPVGYADGIHRILSNQLEAFIGDARIIQVGMITMDQMMFDITDVPDVQVGDTLTLLGENEAGTDSIWLDNWASKMNTIEYELMCALRVRLPRTYVR